MKPPLLITEGKTKGMFACTCGAADYCGSPKACTKESNKEGVPHDA